MSFPVTCLDLAKIKLIKSTFSTEELRFVNILYPHRPPRISFKATVNFTGNNLPEFGSTLICSVRPETTDIARFESLESILNEDYNGHKGFWNQIGYDGTHTYKPCMDQNFNLNLKLRLNAEGCFKFESCWTTEQELKARLVKGDKVEVTVTPGFYFNDESKTFGLYYTVKGLEKIVDKVEKKRK